MGRRHDDGDDDWALDKTGFEEMPTFTKTKSLPVCLPSWAVPSRAEMAAIAAASPTATAVVTLELLPEVNSPSTALAPSRRKKRRHVTFGEAECVLFRTDTFESN